MSQALHRLEKALQQKTPALWATLQRGISEDEVAGFEEALGFKLPADYRVFVMKHNGGDEGTSLFGRFFFMPLDQQVDHRNEIMEQLTSEREENDESPWNEHFIAFGNEHSWKNLLFLDGDGGKVWHYQEGEWEEVAPDFASYLDELARKIESGELVLDNRGRLLPPR